LKKNESQGVGFGVSVCSRLVFVLRLVFFLDSLCVFLYLSLSCLVFIPVLSLPCLLSLGNASITEGRNQFLSTPYEWGGTQMLCLVVMSHLVLCCLVLRVELSLHFHVLSYRVLSCFFLSCLDLNYGRLVLACPVLSCLVVVLSCLVVVLLEHLSFSSSLSCVCLPWSCLCLPSLIFPALSLTLCRLFLQLVLVFSCHASSSSSLCFSVFGVSLNLSLSVERNQRSISSRA
jgi:hypothetical protein